MLPLPDVLHYTTISDEDGYAMGFDSSTIGEFDLEKDLQVLEDILRDLGVTPVRLGFGSDLARQLAAKPPRLLWNLNSGVFGFTREAQVPALCEMLRVPFVGPGAWTAVLTQDKTLAARWLVAEARESIAVASHVLVRDEQELDVLDDLQDGARYIIKPNHDESSRGITDDSVQVKGPKLRHWTLRRMEEWGPVRVERFIDGTNISANAAADETGKLRPLEPIFVEVPALVDSGSTKLGHQRRIYPVRERDPALAERIERLVRDVCRVFRFRHYARIDLRLGDDDQLYFLEANICPSLEPEDDYVIAARFHEISFEKLVRNIVAAAWHDARRGDLHREIPKVVRERLGIPGPQ